MKRKMENNLKKEDILEDSKTFPNFSPKKINIYSRIRSEHCLVHVHLSRTGVNWSSYCDCGEIGSVIFFLNLTSFKSYSFNSLDMLLTVLPQPCVHIPIEFALFKFLDTCGLKLYILVYLFIWLIVYISNFIFFIVNDFNWSIRYIQTSWGQWLTSVDFFETLNQG